jgi:hypothetical protein
MIVNNISAYNHMDDNINAMHQLMGLAKIPSYMQNLYRTYEERFNTTLMEPFYNFPPKPNTEPSQ